MGLHEALTLRTLGNLYILNPMLLFSPIVSATASGADGDAVVGQDAMRCDACRPRSIAASASDKKNQRPTVRAQHVITHCMRFQIYVYFTKTVMAILSTVGPMQCYPHALDP